MKIYPKTLLLSTTLSLGLGLKSLAQTSTTIERFPKLEAQLLSGEDVTFPYFLKGKKVIITMVFEKWARYQKPQAQSDKWKEFWEKELSPSGIDFYEIPMMSGIFSIGKTSIDNAMRSGLEQALHSIIACYYGQKMKYADLLDVEDITDCVIVLLDENGNVVLKEAGPIDEVKKSKFLAQL